MAHIRTGQVPTRPITLAALMGAVIGVMFSLRLFGPSEGPVFVIAMIFIGTGLAILAALGAVLLASNRY